MHINAIVSIALFWMTQLFSYNFDCILFLIFFAFVLNDMILMINNNLLTGKFYLYG